MKMIRPDWEKFINGISFFIQCSCGTILQHRQITREHWQMGHFDYVEPEVTFPDEPVNLEFTKKILELMEQMKRFGLIDKEQKPGIMLDDELKKVLIDFDCTCYKDTIEDPALICLYCRIKEVLKYKEATP